MKTANQTSTTTKTAPSANTTARTAKPRQQYDWMKPAEAEEITNTEVSEEGKLQRRQRQTVFSKGTLFLDMQNRMELRKGVYGYRADGISILDKNHPTGTLMIIKESVPKEKYVAVFFPNLDPKTVARNFPKGSKLESVNAANLHPFSEAEVINHHVSNTLPNEENGVKGTMQTISEEIGNKGVVSLRFATDTPEGVTFKD